MFHAVVQFDHKAVHFFGEVSGYNLETLREYVRPGNGNDGTVRVRMRIDPQDQPAFTGYAGKWRPDHARADAVIQIEIARRHQSLPHIGG